MTEDPLIVFRPEPRLPGAPPPFEVQVGAGEMVLLTGSPAAGASFVLGGLIGEWLPVEARTSLDGADFSSLDHRRRRRKARELRLAWLPSEPALISNITVMENLLLPLRYLGEMGEEQATREAFVLLQAAGLTWASSLLPASLDPEERKAVVLFRGLLRRPRVALLDDPLGGLDAAGLAGVRPLLKATAARGECAILASAADVSPYAGMTYRTIPVTEAWLCGEDPARP